LSPTGGNKHSSDFAHYPYSGGKSSCNSYALTVPLNIVSANHEKLNGNEQKLKALVAQFGPIVSVIDCTEKFQLYGSGVLVDDTCNSNCGSVNHGVVVVGYGTDPEQGDFWLLKNSWGADWGEAGYIRLARNRGNNCNIACHAMYAQ
jgi:cathepsin L